jgi:hypothetical protein
MRVPACTFIKPDGSRCLSAPLREGERCFWHDPEHAREAAEARRLGGLRRKREHTLAGAYEFNGLGTVGDITRLLEIAVSDLLGLESSIARARTIIYAAMAAARLLEVGELEHRLQTLEQAVHTRQLPERSVFDDDAIDGEVVFEQDAG